MSCVHLYPPLEFRRLALHDLVREIAAVGALILVSAQRNKHFQFSQASQDLVWPGD